MSIRTHTPTGLTFVEMLVTIAIFALIMTGIMQSVLYFYRANTTAIEQSYQLDSARRGIELMVRDLREATYGDNGAYPLASVASTSVVFYSDTDRDNETERIEYRVTGLTLMRTVTDPSGNPPQYTAVSATTSVSTYVRNSEEGVPIFTYYRADGTEVTSPSDITDIVSVTVDLIVNIRPLRAPQEFTLRSSATLRNLRPQ